MLSLAGIPYSVFRGLILNTQHIPTAKPYIVPTLAFSYELCLIITIIFMCIEHKFTSQRMHFKLQYILISGRGHAERTYRFLWDIFKSFVKNRNCLDYERACVSYFNSHRHIHSICKNSQEFALQYQWQRRINKLCKNL
jgi:hypothetical protein